MAFSGVKSIQINGKTFLDYGNGTIREIKKAKNRYFPPDPCVYKITDLISGALYIGSTINMQKRASNYLSLSGKDYSKGLFKHLTPGKIKIEILDNCKYLTEEERKRLELNYIKELNTVYPKGLNQCCPVSNKSLWGIDLSDYNPPFVIRKTKPKKIKEEKPRRVPPVIVFKEVYRKVTKKNFDILKKIHANGNPSPGD